MMVVTAQQTSTVSPRGKIIQIRYSAAFLAPHRSVGFKDLRHAAGRYYSFSARSRRLPRASTNANTRQLPTSAVKRCTRATDDPRREYGKEQPEHPTHQPCNEGGHTTSGQFQYRVAFWLFRKSSSTTSGKFQFGEFRCDEGNVWSRFEMIRQWWSAVHPASPEPRTFARIPTSAS